MEPLQLADVGVFQPRPLHPMIHGSPCLDPKALGELGRDGNPGGAGRGPRGSYEAACAVGRRVREFFRLGETKFKEITSGFGLAAVEPSQIVSGWPLCRTPWVSCSSFTARPMVAWIASPRERRRSPYHSGNRRASLFVSMGEGAVLRGICRQPAVGEPDRQRPFLRRLCQRARCVFMRQSKWSDTAFRPGCT